MKMGAKDALSNEFHEAYKRLNKAQKEAVDTIEGPVMVVAGPGTGKTQILTLRIANILQKTDTKPENILALTFTESGARAMRQRLRLYIGAEAYRVPIHTFHGFAEVLIRAYPDSYSRVVGGRPASDIEKIEILENILGSEDIKLLKPIGNPVFYIPHILRALGTMKQEYISPDTFAEIINEQENELSLIPKIHEKGAHKGKVRGEYQKKEKGLQKNKELLFVYRAYEALLSEKRLYDFADMILETVTALKSNEDMLRDLQETYQYILADEHQDVNGSQNEILDLLATYHDAPNLFVVGDEKQAIYRFQGASLENFLYFEERFSKTKTIALTENYRSGQEVLDASHDLVSVESGPASELRVPLTAEAVKNSVVERRAFSHQAVEDSWLIDKTQALLSSNIPPEEIAVIVRTNREVEAVAASLRKSGVSAQASADGDILSHPITNSVRALIDVVAKVNNERALFNILHGSYWGITVDDLVRITSSCSFSQSLTSIVCNKEKLTEIGVKHTENVLRVMEVVNRAREKSITDAPHRILEYLLNESGFLTDVIKNDPVEGGRVIRRIYDEIEEMVMRDGIKDLAGVSAVLDLLSEHNLPLNAPYISTNEQSVSVMTAHKSKGLEFEHVFVPHLVDSLWGGKKKAEYFTIPIAKHVSDDSFDQLDDERRLFYVAMTRAKKGLYISHSNTNADGREFSPSRLLEEIDESLLNEESTSKEEESFNPTSELQRSDGKVAIDKDLLRTLLAERGLSATALNNYLRSPWDYLYRNVMRIPEVQALPMLFGTALHNTLERVTAYHTREQKLPSDTDIKTYLESELGKLPVAKEEYTQLHERGFQALILYIHYVESALPKNTKEEFALRVVLETNDKDFPEITLTGKLDRLDFDEEGNVVLVVDYKSGKPKTRGQIEGKTKDSNGDYKRQLVFYALLLSLYGDERYVCKEGVLSFVEPDSKGAIHEESFTITEEEIEALKTEIITAALEIANGSFLDDPCDPEVSNYCELADSLFRG